MKFKVLDLLIRKNKNTYYVFAEESYMSGGIWKEATDP